VIAEAGGDMQPGEYFVEATRYADLLAPEELGRRAADRALRLLGGRPVATGRYPIVVSPEVGWTLLLRLVVALNGEHLSRKRSWLADRGDKPLGSTLVTIHDDGQRPGGLATTPFDAEGVDTRDVTLLESGAVRGQLTDLAAAKRLGVPSNGNARREGYEALPEIRSSNLYLVPGTSKPGEILASVDQGFWVWGLSGWWIGMEPSNPTFSSAASGLWIEKGQPARAVARVTIAGSMEEILGGIDMVADDLVWDHATKTPTFRVRELAVSGT
jgi:PmbA protein